MVRVSAWLEIKWHRSVGGSISGLYEAQSCNQKIERSKVVGTIRGSVGITGGGEAKVSIGSVKFRAGATVTRDNTFKTIQVTTYCSKVGKTNSLITVMDCR